MSKAGNLAELALALIANADGTVSGETPASGDASAKLATTEFVNPGALLAANGYAKFSNGLILQWGIFETSTNATGTETFPIAFPTAGVAILTQHREDEPNYLWNVKIQNTSTFRWSRAVAGNNEVFQYLAIGF